MYSGRRLKDSRYSCAIMPLVCCQLLQSERYALNCKEVWYIDGSAAAGSIEDVQKWWDNLKVNGPCFCHYQGGLQLHKYISPDRTVARRKRLLEAFGAVAIKIENRPWLQVHYIKNNEIINADSS